MLLRSARTESHPFPIDPSIPLHERNRSAHNFESIRTKKERSRWAHHKITTESDPVADVRSETPPPAKRPCKNRRRLMEEVYDGSVESTPCPSTQHSPVVRRCLVPDHVDSPKTPVANCTSRFCNEDCQGAETSLCPITNRYFCDSCYSWKTDEGQSACPPSTSLFILAILVLIGIHRKKYTTLKFLSEQVIAIKKVDRAFFR